MPDDDEVTKEQFDWLQNRAVVRRQQWADHARQMEIAKRVMERNRDLLSKLSDETLSRIGAYPVDYSEPTAAEIADANASCENLFKTGDWVPVNRKS